MKSFLRDISIFSELNDEELDLLAETAREKKYEKNSTIVREGEASASLFIIRSGAVNVVLEKETGGEVHLSTLRQGSYFGEMSLFDESTRSATVTAQEDTTVVEISREDFLQQITKSPRIALKILSEMSCRFRRTDETVKVFADRVSREAYINLEKILNTQLESAKLIFQNTENRASRTLEHVESSWKTLIRIVTVLMVFASILGGFFGFMGFKKYSHLEEIHEKAKKIEKEMDKAAAKLRQAKILSDIVLKIRQVNDDVNLEFNLDEELEDMDIDKLENQL
jgi:CRP-like cAMP-binding protein